MEPLDWLAQGWMYILSICAMITAVGAAVAYFRKAVNAITAPHREMSDRLDAAIEQHGHYDTCLDNDNRRLGQIEGAMTLMLRSQMDLVAHEVDGNHTKQLKEDQEELRDYLIKRSMR